MTSCPTRRCGWGSYSPSDFEPGYRGDVTIEDALALSLNTAAVRLLLVAGGPKPVAAVAHRLGIADSLPDNALPWRWGRARSGVLEMAAAYAAFFNGGYAVSATGIEQIQADGRPFPLPRPPHDRVIDPDLDAMMLRMLTAVVTRGQRPARPGCPGGWWRARRGPRRIIGMRGSSAAWVAAGGVGGTVVAVWLGNDDDRPMNRVTGGSLPARLFHDIAAEIR